MTATVPMRSEPAHRSEMTNQLLFGDRVQVLASSGDFVQTRTAYEQYEGWCQKSQLLSLPAALANAQPFPGALTADITQEIQVNGEPLLVPLGADLSLFKDNRLTIGDYVFEHQGPVHQPQPQDFNPAKVSERAHAYLNTAYLWGGRSVFGIDCSGFTQQVYRFFGQYLPRDAYQQAALGQELGFLAEAQGGDLAFFDNAEGRITHVGILLGPDRIIHASGKVRIDPIDPAGIVHAITGERTHHLRLLRRFLP